MALLLVAGSLSMSAVLDRPGPHLAQAAARPLPAQMPDPSPSRSYHPVYRPTPAPSPPTTGQGRGVSSSPRPSRTSRPAPRLNPDRQVVVAFALAQVGDPYVWGAEGPGAYDCSGLVLAAFAHAGYAMPRFSGAQHRMGRAAPVSSLDAGDLVAWRGHVAIWLGGGRLVEAARPGTLVRVRRFDPGGSWFDAGAWGVSLDYSRLPRR